MLRVEIEYCQHWGHALRAAWMAGVALTRAGPHNESLTLVPSEHDKFHIRTNGVLVAAHQHLPDAQNFPDLQDLMQAINERIEQNQLAGNR